jgi:hypothetical protein
MNLMIFFGNIPAAKAGVRKIEVKKTSIVFGVGESMMKLGWPEKFLS